MVAITLVVSLVAGITHVFDVRNLDGEVGRFPPAAVVSRYFDIAESHHKWLRQNDPQNLHRLRRQSGVLDAYACLMRARDVNLSRKVRGEAALDLQQHLSKADYFFGRLPMPLPVMEKKD